MESNGPRGYEEKTAPSREEPSRREAAKERETPKTGRKRFTRKRPQVAGRSRGNRMR